MSYKDTLFSQLKIGSRTCANRFFAGPIECCDADPDGNPSELTRARYERLFGGGWGAGVSGGDIGHRREPGSEATASYHAEQ